MKGVTNFCRSQRGSQTLPLKKTMGGGAGQRPEGRDNRPLRPAERKKERKKEGGDSPGHLAQRPSEPGGDPPPQERQDLLDEDGGRVLLVLTHSGVACSKSRNIWHDAVQ